MTAHIIRLTEEITECDCCGRSGLRHTVEIDVDGDIVHYGTSCAAKIHVGLGKAADIKLAAQRRCDLGCGRSAGVMFASGRKLCHECNHARRSASTAA